VARVDGARRRRGAFRGEAASSRIGETFLGTFKNSLRATAPATGKVMWQHEYLEPHGINARYASVVTTAGGLLFTGDISGNLVAFDVRTGKILWHDELPEASLTGVPVSYPSPAHSTWRCRAELKSWRIGCRNP
jgi:alcohol dehydrogenase (cytochrome c)